MPPKKRVTKKKLVNDRGGSGHGPGRQPDAGQHNNEKSDWNMLQEGESEDELASIPPTVPQSAISMLDDTIKQR